MHTRTWFALAVTLISAPVRAQQKVIEISGAKFRPMPVAFPAPQTGDPGATAALPEFEAAMAFDIAASGIFKLLDRRSYLAPATEGMDAADIAFSAWRDVGAEGLIKIALTTSDGMLRGTLALFSVGSGFEQLKIRAEAPMRTPRKLAHALAEGLYASLINEKGPFETKITFTRPSKSGRNIWVSDWDGSDAKQLTSSGLNVLPAIKANEGVAYTAYKGRGAWVYLTGFGGGQGRPLVREGSLATGVAFRRDGSRLAVAVTTEESAEIWVGNADGTKLRPTTATSYFLNTSPSWAADGQTLAFVSNRAGTPQIYMMNADGSEVRRLTFQGKYNQTPSLSPRGDLIAFTGRDERGVFDIFTVNVNTLAITRLTQNSGSNEEPTFSPTGRLIMFTSTRSGQKQLYVMTPDGENQLPLPMKPGGEDTPDWGG